MNSICVFGDSVARGVIYDETKEKYAFLKNSFINTFSERFKIPVTNYAKFGCTITKGIDILSKHLNELEKYEFTILEFGGNDCDYNWKEISDSPNSEHVPNVSFEMFRERYEDIINQVRSSGSKPVILSLPPIDSNRFFDWVSQGLDKDNILKWLGSKDRIFSWHEQYNEIILSLANKHKIPVIDIRNAFFENNRYSDYICKDGIHPNEKGHALISNHMEVSMFN